jgi:hypothetical protein
VYYAYGALVSFWVGENDLEVWPERHNPFFGYDFGEVGNDNKNLYLHPDSDAFGNSDAWLGIRVVRLASVVLGTLTVWVIYRVGREVFPDRPELGLGAAGLGAFIPQFLFVSGAVNDDNGATLFGALALWAMMRMLRKGPNWRRAVGLGLALGMGWLSKLTVVALIPTAGLALGVAVWRDHSWRELLRLGLIMLGVAAILVVPWLVRQTLLYGDPTGTSAEMREWGLPDEPVTLADLGPDLYWLRTSFWGRLGYNQIPLSRWIYVLLDAVTVLAVLGLIRLLILHLRSAPTSLESENGSRPAAVRRSQFVILTCAVLLTFGPMMVRRFLRPMPNFGRYLFPVLPAIAILIVTGLSAWLPRRHDSRLAVAVTSAMVALGVAGVTCFLAPAYQRPPTYAAAGAPVPSHALDRTCLENDQPLARLLGYDLDQPVAEPGGTARVALHWEVLAETEANYVLFAQLFGRNGAKVGQRDTYPGLGHYPTSFWRPGEVIIDEIPIPVASGALAPSRLRLDVGLYERGNGRLTVVDGSGRVVDTATVGLLKLASAQPPAPPAVPLDYRLGDGIHLIGYEFDAKPELAYLRLHWSCLAALENDYTVFVHLLDGDGELVAQADGPPVGGDYPTSFWAPGETVVGERVLNIAGLSSGIYELRVGMYLRATGDRLPLIDGDGNRQVGDAVSLTEVQLP